MKTHAWRPVSLILVTLLVAIPLAWATESYAQAGPQGMAPSAGEASQVQGTIKTVDPTGKSLTLDDGTQLTIPPTVNVPRGMLKEGTIVKASFEEKAGQKVVTSLEIQQPW